MTLVYDHISVYVECYAGSYGIDCEKRCSRNCAGSYQSSCDHVTGACDYGCKPGFTGPVCDDGELTHHSAHTLIFISEDFVKIIIDSVGHTLNKRLIIPNNTVNDYIDKGANFQKKKKVCNTHL